MCVVYCCSSGVVTLNDKSLNILGVEMRLGMSAPGNYVAPEERERRLRELANRLADEERVQSDTVSQTKREYANIKQDLTQEFLKFIKISEECEMDRAILEAVVYKDIA
jgi:hypothetical protein